LDSREWRRLAGKLMRQVVNVRFNDAPKPVDREKLEKCGFHHCLHLGNPKYDEALLRVAIVDETDELRNLEGDRASQDRTLKYRDDFGYWAGKERDGKSF
jgi:CRISPR-associated endonuclease/helicase Cas3